MVLCPKGRTVLQPVANAVRVDRRGADLHLAGGCDAARKRQCICNAGRIPTSTEQPRHRKRPKRGRTRLVNAALHA
jgi:hypothetical protein